MKVIEGLTGVVEKDGIRMPQSLFDYGGISYAGWHEGNAVFTPIWHELVLIKKVGIDEYVQKHYYKPGKPLSFEGKKQWATTRKGGIEYATQEYFQKRTGSIKSILDVGCGQGEVGVWFSTAGIQYVGVDIAMVNVGFCIALLPCLKFKNPNCPMPIFRYMRGEKLGFADKTFDVVFSCHSLEHVQDLGRALAEQSRVAKAICGVVAKPREDESGEHMYQITPGMLEEFLCKHCVNSHLKILEEELVFWGDVR